MNAHPDPGPPEQRLSEVLAAYLEAIDAGWAPEEQAFLDHYPDLAPDLAAFFQNQLQVAQLAHSLPPPMHANGRGYDNSGSWNPNEAPTLPQSDSSPSTDPHLDNVRYFDGYEILEEISRGGMGIVFKARQRGLSRLVALKMILAGQFASPVEIQRFLHESENASLLDHPNIVPIYTVGEYHGQRYFTMKLIEGGNLSKHLPRLSQDLKAGVRVLVTVAQAVHYAHQRGILHRDLKPANILLDPKGQPHITDFGLAKRIPVNVDPDAVNLEAGYVAPEQIAQRDGHLTTVDDQVPGQGATLSAVAGTPSYMPPEQAGPQRGGLTTAADVYGVGAILYKLLTGQPPFRGATWQETLELVREREPASPHSLKPHVPRDLEAICLKCLNKKPERRYASAQALANDLENWLKGAPVDARPRAWPARLRRTLYCHAFLCIFMVVAGFAAGLAVMAWYWSDPKRPLEANLRRLESGERITLIGEEGPPSWFHILPDVKEIWVSSARDRPYDITAHGYGRLQLLPKVPAPSYRFSVEVRHDDDLMDPQDGSYVGIFFNHAGQGQQSYWNELVFADYGHRSNNPSRKGKDTSRVALFVWHRVPGTGPEDVVHNNGSVSQVGTWFEPARATSNITWRFLSVVVRPDKVEAFWGEHGPESVTPIGEASRADLHDVSKAFLLGDNLPPQPVLYEFAPEGSLGLVVHRGTASFRRVVVEPLP